MVISKTVLKLNINICPQFTTNVFENKFDQVNQESENDVCLYNCKHLSVGNDRC